MKRLLFGAILATILCLPANAACWKLKNGSIVESNSNSSPPVKGAKLVDCASNRSKEPNISKRPTNSVVALPAEGISESRPDSRECVAYVRSRKTLPSGIPYEKPDSEHLAWKKGLIDPSQRIKVGAIAITGGHPAGHMSIIEGFGSSGSTHWITVSETNWKRGFYHKRTVHGQTLEAAEAKLKILGYRL